jgi:anti-anti-sigma regulatory factor
MNKTVPSPTQSNNSSELCIQISFRTSGTPTARLTLTGNILKSNLKLLRSAFNECLTNKKSTVIVDMKKVDIVSDAGWKHLVAEKKRLLSKDVTFLLCRLRPEVHAAFTDLQLHGMLRTFSTITECQKEIELISKPLKDEPLKGASKTTLKTHSLEITAQNNNSELNSNLKQIIPAKEINSSGCSVPEKIHAIISKYGPCSVLQILSHLHSTEFEKEKIGLIKLSKVLKEMNCETQKKRERFFRSC